MVEISVVIPAYNEEQNLESTVNELVKALDSWNMNYEIIIIDDGSEDKTPLICQGLSNYFKAVRNVRQTHSGKAVAIITGVKNSQSEKIVMIDADGQYDPKDMKKFLESLQHFDVVLGRRTDRKDSISRKILSFVFNNLFKMLFLINVHDINCGFKAFRKEVFERINFSSYYWLVFDAELINEAYRNRFRVTEIGVNHRFRRKGKSKINIFSSSVRTFLELFKYRLRISA